ncbi:hypothetical protein L195_g009528 [Trifolium pratense]|uniref:Cysteine-rich receptor-like protein kinase n=1 Tax=Trifolium pratense TaxID=57577 RepID=A0A2K3PCA3_TRIPR|nr:hypothetical protein L195_g009528 [Trifolium pratense]
MFTQFNNQEDRNHIKARLERFLATSNWINCFPLNRYTSDHRPILINFSSTITNNSPLNHYPKRFEQIWLKEDQCHKIVKNIWSSDSIAPGLKIGNTLNSLYSCWGRDMFGNVPKRIKEHQDQLSNIYPRSENNGVMNHISILEKDIDDMLECEELWWSQRTKAMWLKDGDKNTKYFRVKASLRRNKNKIKHVRMEDGTISDQIQDIQDVFTSYFTKISYSSNPEIPNSLLDVVSNRVTPDMQNMLNTPFWRR